MKIDVSAQPLRACDQAPNTYPRGQRLRLPTNTTNAREHVHRVYYLAHGRRMVARVPTAVANATRVVIVRMGVG